MNLERQEKKRVVIGVGQTGQSCMRFFSRSGLPFSVFDTRENPEGNCHLLQEYSDVDFRFGAAKVAMLDEADQLVLSPGVDLSDPIFRDIDVSSKELTNDIAIFSEIATAPKVLITGSNAKSTVTTLVGKMAESAGLRVAVGGNLGKPALDLLDDESEAYILELSSFQLEYCSNLGAKVAAILNISNDHLDRHHSMDNYQRIKQRIYQGAESIIFNRHDPLTRPLDSSLSTSLKSFGIDQPKAGHYGVVEIEGKQFISRGLDLLLAVEEIPLQGEHHLMNFVAAIAIGDMASIPVDAMVSAIKGFDGLPHRCERVAVIAGVTYYNDSKATNEGATLSAVRSMSKITDGEVVVILGGRAKQNDFSSLFSQLQGIRYKLIVIGESAELIKRFVPADIFIINAETLPSAVEQAQMISSAGDIVLLSPACASFDMFDSFEQRGEVFKHSVLGLTSDIGDEVNH